MPSFFVVPRLVADRQPPLASLPLGVPVKSSSSPPPAAWPGIYRLLLLLLGIWVTGSAQLAYGQNAPDASAGTPLLPQRIPPAPTTAALERYALMPVNEPAGTPTIAIPLYEIHSGQLSLPITATYHAAGVHVSDEASWLGLGWSLNAGGMISHIVNGGADEQPGGFREHPRAVPAAASISYPQQVQYLSDIANNIIDYQPDAYAFNMAGQAGTFMQGNDSLFHFLPLQPLHLTVSAGDTAFQLTDAHGTQYYFGSHEYMRLAGRPKSTSYYIASWYLDRIVSADRADTIRLEYSRYFAESVSYQQQQTILSYADIYDRIPKSGLQSGFTETATRVYRNNLRLSRIIFKTGTLEFVGAGGRRDNVWEQRLSKLHVVARDGRDTLKTVTFFHAYFDRIGPDTARTEKFGLRLDSLQIRAPLAAIAPPYRFTYNTQVPLATRSHGSRDHWGYHNGARVIPIYPTGALLIPTIPQVQNYFGGLSTYQGADRAPNPASVQAGILTDIRYPTGGWQHFQYEPNTIAQRDPVPKPQLAFYLSVTAAADTGDGPPTAGKDSTFQILYPVTVVSWTINIAKGGGNDPVHNTGSIALSDLTTGNSVASWNGAQTVQPQLLLLVGHTYKVSITVRGSASAVFDLHYEATATTYQWHNVLTGGLRLRAEATQPARQALLTTRRYDYANPHSALSSGYAIRDNHPLYSRYLKADFEYNFPAEEGEQSPTQFQYATHTVLSSTSLTDVAGGDRIVGYTWVSVVDSSSTGQTNGRTVSQYLGNADLASDWHPPIPAVSNSWQRDQLLSRSQYALDQADPTGTRELLVSKQENDYAVLDNVVIRGLSVGPDVSVSSSNNLDRLEREFGDRSYLWLTTQQTSGWLALRQSRQYAYYSGDSTAYHLTTTTYQYANPVHQQPTLVETTLSGGQHQQVRSRYAADMDTTTLTTAASPAAQAVREQLRNYAVGELVEQTTTRSTATDTLVTASSLTRSRVVAPGVVVADRQLRYAVVQPLPWRQFHPAHLAAGQLQTDPHYETRVIFDAYSAQRQLTQVRESSGSPLSYLWETSSQQPLAKATNATVQQLAVTSFEPGGAGRWRYDTHLGSGQHLVAGTSHSGRWAYRLDSNYAVSRDSLPAGAYVLTFWYQGAAVPLVLGAGSSSLGTPQVESNAPNDWHQARLRLQLASGGVVRVDAPAGATPLVDEITLLPVGAQVTTYTYDPLRGMTSQTDPTGRTITYEYDGLGRLLRTRDEQGRILSQQQYHYAGQ